MATTLTLERLKAMQGKDVRSVDGEKIGSVDRIFIDETSQDPEWIALDNDDILPIDGATIVGDEIRVSFTKNKVDDEPDVEPDENGYLDPDKETELRQYFGLVGESLAHHRVTVYRYPGTEI
jgi:sporulation protein YlmC with PRC-barrel domain